MKRITTNLLLVIVLLLTFASGCQDSSGPVPDQIYSHTLSSSNSSPDGAQATAYYSGKTKGDVISSGKYGISFTTKNLEEHIDSFKVEKSGYKTFIMKNFTVNTDNKTINVSLEKVPGATKIFWLYSENSTAGATVKPFDNGQELSATTVGDDSSYKSASMDVPTDGVLDSIVVSKDGYDKEVFKNVAVIENGNQFDVTLQEQPQYITLDGRTFMIGKIADERNYSLNDPAYIDSRMEGNVSFLFLTADGNFRQQVTSDADGKFHLQIPKAEMGQTGIYIMNPDDKMYGAMIAVALDSLKNTENVGALNKNVDRRNMLQGHMRYDIDESGTLIASPVNENRTSNWMAGQLTHVRMEKVSDNRNNVWTDEYLTQEMDNMITNTITILDNVMNNFFKNGKEIITDDLAGTPSSQSTLVYVFTDDPVGAAGYFGKRETDGVVVHAESSVNKDYMGDTMNTFQASLTQELGSNKVFYEQSSSKAKDANIPPSAFDGLNAAGNITDNDRVSLEWYQIRSEKESEQDATKGIWNGTGDIDQIAMEKGKDLQDVQDYISTYGSTEAQAKFAEIQSSTKAATMPQTTYTYKVIMLNGTVKTRVFTRQNYRQALGDETIPKRFQEEIRKTFEK